MTRADAAIEPHLRSHSKKFPLDPRCPFPVGVEYYRAPVPPTKFWDEDLARIRAAGMCIVRTFTPWNWIEREPGKFDFDDFDMLFDLAAKRHLRIWLDTPVGTHMACPEWMIRKHPDMKVEKYDGRVQHPTAGRATPLGAMIHNFDHPKWREYVERFIRAIVRRYKDHPALLIWGTWDGINFASAWADNDGMPPYNDYTIEKYKGWLKERFTLAELGERLMRRLSSWEDVDAPRSNDAIVEMTLYRRFHYENMAAHLGWLADLIDRLDGKHEQRSHGASYPRPWDEIVSPRIDSWGLSHHSADRLSSPDPYSVASECFGFQWARAVGRDGRWWNEEIYSSFVGGLRPRGKSTLPEESTVFLWLSLIEGASGALYWQYRPEYMSFEAPGLNLASLDGRPTPRLAEISRAIEKIDSLAEHLPLVIPRSELAVGYSPLSHEVFTYADQRTPFIYEQRGVYRTLWAHSVAQDIVTPDMDWSPYRAVYLPNFALLDQQAISRVRETLAAASGPSLIVDGHFGTFSGKGHWSFHPPEGLDDLIDVRIVDFDKITERDILEGRNTLVTEYGNFQITSPCQYAILEPGDRARPIATLGDRVVGVRSADRRLTWFGLSLSLTSSTGTPGQPSSPANSTGVGHPDLVLPLFRSVGIRSWFNIRGDRLVAFRRQSRRGGSLVFLLNVEQRTARATVTPTWQIRSATDVHSREELAIKNGGFEVEIPFGGVHVIHCDDR